VQLVPERLTRPQRSQLMSRIQSRNTLPERIMRQALLGQGLLVRRQYGSAKADFAIPRSKIAIFVDGCFWHGCPRHYQPPANNGVYWKAKLQYNQRRDRRLRRALALEGWVVVRVWEHSLPKHADRFARHVRALDSDRTKVHAAQRQRPRPTARHSRSG
jgi:DNA mismatch endonuclease, patch repair protein